MKFLFSLMIFFVTLFNIVYIPIKLAFDASYDLFDSDLPERATIGFMVAEICVNMSTQFYMRTELVTDRVSVLKRYLSKRVW